MLSKVEICNIALNKCGAKTIRSFDEENKNARVCEAVYDIYREDLQTKYDWTFCTKYVQLSMLEESGTDVLPYVFALPADCLRPREVRPFSPSVNWQRVGKKLFTNIDEAYLFYSANIVDTAQFPAYFALALAGQIANQIAVSLVQDVKILQSLVGSGGSNRGWAAELLMDALEVDGSSNFEYKSYDGTADNDKFVNP